jgi:hypothetical protein
MNAVLASILAVPLYLTIEVRDRKSLGKTVDRALAVVLAETEAKIATAALALAEKARLQHRGPRCRVNG